MTGLATLRGAVAHFRCTPFVAVAQRSKGALENLGART